MGIVQLKCLGAKGRFGNSLFQYAFGRMYAERYGHTLLIPSHWMGRVLFPNVKEDSIDENVTLPRVGDTDLICHPELWGKGDIELDGYFQSIKLIPYLSRKECRKWFQISQDIRDKCPRLDYFYVAAHLRRGDYYKYNHIYPMIEEESVSRAVKKFGYKYEDIVWITDGITPKRDTRFDDRWDFMPDFLRLIEAPVLFRSNSTFAWWACVLQENGKCYCPLFQSGKGGWVDADYEEGNNAWVGGLPHRSSIGD